MRPRWTVRLRLTLLYGSLFLVCGAVLLVITYGLVDHATDKGTMVTLPNGATAGVASSRPHQRAPRQPGSTQQRSQDGRIVKNTELTPKQLEAQAKRIKALAARQHEEQMHQLLVQSGVALGATALLSIVLGWLVAGRALRPLRRITATAREISATNLHERLALDGPDDELTELGDTFDGLLDRLEASFRAQHQFVANASHELRTPLTRQRTLIQVALADPDATVESLGAAHERVLVSGAQQERIIDGLLTLTRGQAGLDQREPLDLAAAARPVVAARRDEAEAHGVDLRAALTPAPTVGDARLVERLVVNLVDNALQYNEPGGWIQVTTGRREGRSVVSVINTGPVVPADAVERLFQPFQRLGADRTHHGGGVGLGLSIVQAVADAHDATVMARPRAHGGLQVKVVFGQSSAASATVMNTRRAPGPRGRRRSVAAARP